MDLSPHIEKGADASAICLRSVSKECKSLVLSRTRTRTLKTKHLLLLSESKSGCIVFAVEVYVYLLFHENEIERHIFVSKADTTGLSECRISVAGVIQEYIQHLLSIPVSTYIDGAKWREEDPKESNAFKNNGEEINDARIFSEFDIVNTLNELSEKVVNDPTFYQSIPFYLKQNPNLQHNNKTIPIPVPSQVLTKVCLFTRSADSYIFPYSQKNTGKHIADGNALFKWWIGVLAKTLDNSWKCKADIPGSDSRAVERFLPDGSNWSVGNIYVDENPDEKAVYTIPLFPDDPKGRFLEHLIVENRYKAMTTIQFWNELGYRQEFRLGNVVGIISCSQRKPQALTEANGVNDTSITTKTYKKLMELLKDEDFSEKDEIQTTVKSTIPAFFKQAGVDVTPLVFTGTKPQVTSSLRQNNATTAVNKLSSLVVKRARNEPGNSGDSTGSEMLRVNNLTGLVKRRKDRRS